MDEETEEEVIALQSMFDGSRYGLLALALAMLDAGVIDRRRLLAIIESLHGILAADYVGAIGSGDDAEVALNRMREWLDGFDWRAGSVVEELHKIETQEFLRTQMKLANSRHRRRPPRDE